VDTNRSDESGDDAPEMNGAAVIVAALEQEGIERVHGVPGEETLALVEALHRSEIDFVVTRHEQHAAFMAATEGRLTGRPGVVLSTLGPGATNLATGLAHATLGSMPLLALTGQKALRGNDQGQFQMVDVVGALRPLTKWNARVEEARAIPRLVRQALDEAIEGRPGAVHLEVPEDVAGDPASSLRPIRSSVLGAPRANEQSLARAATAIGQARHVVVLVSSGGQSDESSRALQEFAEVTGAHVVMTQLGKGAIPENHPRSLFTLGIHALDLPHAAFDAADLVVTVGYDVAEYPPAQWTRDGDLDIVHVDVVPPRPEVAYAPGHAVVGEIAHSLDALRELVGARAPSDDLARLREVLDVELATDPHERVSGAVRTIDVVASLQRVLEPEDVVALDNGIYKLWFARHYRARRPRTVLLDNTLATMGAGLAAAMSAALLDRDRHIVAVCGDGGLAMNLQDLETLVRLDLPVVVLVPRDDGYGFIRWKARVEDRAEAGVKFGNPDLVALGAAFGMQSARVDSPGQLDGVIAAALEARAPFLIDCPVDFEANDALLPSALRANARAAFERHGMALPRSFISP